MQHCYKLTLFRKALKSEGINIKLEKRTEELKTVIGIGSLLNALNMIATTYNGSIATYLIVSCKIVHLYIFT